MFNSANNIRQLLIAWVFFLAAILFCSYTHAQITAPTASSSQPTTYTNYSPNDEIYIFCTPDANGNPVTGSLTATPAGGTAPFTYTWGSYVSGTQSYTTFQTVSNVPSSTVTGLASGGYRVVITDANGNHQCYQTWVFINLLTVSVLPIPPGCTPFTMTGNIASGFDFIYYDPPPSPFIIGPTTSITVCFTGVHTYVSDLGFYLVGPPSCGSPTLPLAPNPQQINSAWGCCCNSGDNFNSLCFSTANTNMLLMCTGGLFGGIMATPLTGTFGIYGQGTPDNFNANQNNWSPIYGCDATLGGWSVQVYDCIAADVGALTNATLTFSGTSSCGPSTITYNSGNISSAIHDNSCTPATASIYTVPFNGAISHTLSHTYSYQWSANPAYPVPVSLTPLISPAPLVNTWFILTGMDNIGCIKKDSALFIFTAPALATITPAGPFCITDAPFQLVAASPGGTWSGTGVSATGLFTPATAGAGSFPITYTIPNPCGNSDTKTIVVNQVVYTSAFTNVLCNGGSSGSITINAPTSGTAPFQYSIDNGTTTQAGGTFNNLPAGTYNLKVIDAQGCLATSTVTITEPAGMTASITAANNISCNGAADGAINITVSGGTIPYSYNWSPGGQITQNLSNLTAGAYSVTITDNNGCSAVLDTMLIEPLPLTATETHTPVSCNGLNDGSINLTPNGGTIPYIYSWMPGGITTQNLNNLIAGTYSVTVTDNSNCTTSLSITITEPPVLTLQETHTNISCSGGNDGSINITPGGGAPLYLYSWSNSAATQNVSNLTAGNYTVTLTDANNCTATLTITLTQPQGLVLTETHINTTCNAGTDGSINITITGGTVPISYSWSPGGQTTGNINMLTAGPYTVIVTDGLGCALDSTITITEPTPLVVVIPAVSTLCIGQSATLHANASGSTSPYTYSWSSVPADPTLTTPTVQSPVVAPVINTTYSVTVTDVNLCTSQPVSSTINVFPALHITVTAGGPNPICVGDSTSINLSASGGNGQFTFGWIEGASPVTSPVNVHPLDTIMYHFYVRDGCTTPADTDSIQIIVNPLPVINFSAVPVAGCQPLSVNFTYNANGNPVPNSFAWNFGDNAAVGNTSNAPAPSHIYHDAGVYSVKLTATSAQGCIDSLTNINMITVYQLPHAGIIAHPKLTHFLDPNISFESNSTGASQWNWTFGDSGTSTLENPQHFYLDTGTFVVWLKVTTLNGCVDSTTDMITIIPDFMLYVPNGFTPNGDGLNDTFLARGDGIKTDGFSMRIFNRWGSEVFRSRDITKGWDGTFEGIKAQSDVYAWVIIVTDINDVDRKFMGHVTLLR